jgi:hypothetical protein
MKSLVPIILALSAPAAIAGPDAGACHAKSPAHAVALVELYTSEGCSSCPPADRWLRQLPGQAAEQLPIVPLALHVDYWNSIGWTDRFSSHVYTDRQNWLSGLAHTRVIYTPEVFVNGHEVREWSDGSVLRLAQNALAQPAPAAVTISEHQNPDGTYEALATLDRVQGKHGQVALVLALYENNVTTVVKAGENSGATLKHDFATRALSDPAPAENGHATVTLAGRLPAGSKPENLGFVAFAQDTENGDVLEAVALAACAP